MRESLLPQSSRVAFFASKARDFDPRVTSDCLELCNPPQPQGFDELIASLRECDDSYSTTQVANCVTMFLILPVTALSLFLMFMLVIYQCNGLSPFSSLSDFFLSIACIGLMFITCCCCIAILSRQYPLLLVEEENPFLKLLISPAGKRFRRQLRHFPQVLEKLTQDPNEINNLLQSLVVFRNKYFALVKKCHPAIGREKAISDAKTILHLPSWIFDAPGLQLQQAVYHKVAEHLDELFLECLPVDCTQIITGYLVPFPHQRGANNYY